MQNFARQFSNDPRLATLLSETEKAFQLYRKETTGAQASDKELQLLRPNLPSITESPAIFFSKIDSTMNGTRRAQKALLDTYGKAGYDVQDFYSQETPADNNQSQSGKNIFRLKDPKTGKIAEFENLSVADLQDAIKKGYIRI
jgi:hypothetical protein